MKKKKNKKRLDYKIHKIDIPIYGSVLYVFVGKVDLFLRYARNKYKVKFSGGDLDFVGRFYSQTEDSPSFIVIPEFNWTIDQQIMLVHEIQHFVFWLPLDCRNIPLVSESEEVYTYLTQYVMDKIWTIFEEDYEKEKNMSKV